MICLCHLPRRRRKNPREGDFVFYFVFGDGLFIVEGFGCQIKKILMGERQFWLPEQRSV